MVTPISDMIFSGFVSKIVNNGVDASWTKIRKVIKSKKTEHQNMESQIYSIIINALNQVTYNEYENNQDKVYQAAEKLLLGYEKVKSDDITVVKSGLQVLGERVNNDKYIEFKGLIYNEISKKENIELYHKILLWLLDQKNKYDQLEIEQLNQKLNAVLQILGTKETESNLQHSDIKREIKSRTQEYADKWNQNMFLNDFDEWDENAGVNVKLSEVYIDEHLPHFIYGYNENESDNLDVLLSKHIMKTKENKMLLILGQPGIGKSTLITWITVNFADRINDILIYRFASDLGNIDWKNGAISNRVLEELGLNHSDLNGKILIFDGFDEVSIEASRRRDILDNLYDNWIYNKTIENFTLIITCRENYVQRFTRLECKYIALQPWDETQIKSFCNIFQEKTKNIISEDTIKELLLNREIMGIPLILYMVLALNISIEKEGSIVDVYDKIFSLDGGIYDRCINNKKFAEKHRIGDVKKYIHQITREISLWMFENEADKASIPREEYRRICSTIICEEYKNEEIKQDFLIGNFFKLVKHFEGIETEELYFVHRTIYEYFVVETIYSSIENSMIELSDASQGKLAGNIAGYLKQGEIDYTLGEYLRYKILKLYSKLSIEKQALFYQWWEKAVKKMMKMGMFYYTKKTSNYINIFAKETQCFNNIIEILRLIFDANKNRYILEDADQVLLMRYIKHSLVECRILYIDDMEIDNTERVCDGYVLDLSKLSLIKANFELCNLSEVNLKYSTLRLAILSKANLEGANLRGADLRQANLEGANLRGADLRQANFEEAIIDEFQVVFFEKKYGLYNVRVYFNKTREIISYSEYCRRKE